MKSSLGPPSEKAMTNVSIDRAPAAVKQFFETLSLTPEGSVVKMNGKPLARMLPMAAPETPWSPAKNHRRCDLIDRDIAGTITADESLELELLTEELQRHVERVAPIPLEYVRKLHKRLLVKAGLAESPGPR